MATPKPVDDLIINEPNNDQIVANLPKFENEAGTKQVVIDDNGWIVGEHEEAKKIEDIPGFTPAAPASADDAPTE